MEESVKQVLSELWNPDKYFSGSGGAVVYSELLCLRVGWMKPTQEGFAAQGSSYKVVPQGTQHSLVFKARACTL